jgi:hypothetical protein
MYQFNICVSEFNNSLLERMKSDPCLFVQKLILETMQVTSEQPLQVMSQLWSTASIDVEMNSKIRNEANCELIFNEKRYSVDDFLDIIVPDKESRKAKIVTADEDLTGTRAYQEMFTQCVVNKHCISPLYVGRTEDVSDIAKTCEIEQKELVFVNCNEMSDNLHDEFLKILLGNISLVVFVKMKHEDELKKIIQKVFI